MRKPLGTILIERGVCTPEQLETALEQQRTLANRNHYKHIGTIMLELKLISLQDLHRALEWQQLLAAER